MRARLGAVGLLVVFGALQPARGDYEETEQRLKGAGVSAGLRTKVHKGIDRCVAYLVSRQKPNGSFTCRFSSETDANTTGVTLLCALALRHAGTPATAAPVAKAVAWLFDGKDVPLADIETNVYSAGLALMLLHDIGRPQPEAPRLASALARGLDGELGWWGYDTPGPASDGAPAEPAPYKARDPNLSTAQFAALGLWAARRMGIETHISVWRRHAESLLAAQSKFGSWPYLRGSAYEDGPGLPQGATESKAGYFTGTCMGLANLLLARQALRGPPAAPDELLARIETAISSALACLRADAPTVLEDPAAGDILYLEGSTRGLRLPMASRAAMPGMGAFYTLYALEKACLFADLEALGSAAALEPGARRKPSKPQGKSLYWYAATAEWLLSVEERSGGWSVAADAPPSGPPNVVDSALALLILVRSPSTSHPTTPREVDARLPAAVTPGDPPAPQKQK